MATRLSLQILLESLLGSSNVYFQPPETVKLLYPCIVYERSLIRTDFANNKPYAHKKRYTITVIDKNPDSSILEKISNLVMCSHDRHFTASNLNHDVYNIFF